MNWVLERCKTYKQTELATSVTAELTESETPVSKQTDSETSVTADWVVQLTNLSYLCTGLDITRLFNMLGMVTLIII